MPKLAVRDLQRGVGSMGYIHSLLIMEDDLDETEDMCKMIAETETTVTTAMASGSSAGPKPSPASSPSVNWCTCGLCRPMPQA